MKTDLEKQYWELLEKHAFKPIKQMTEEEIDTNLATHRESYLRRLFLTPSIYVNRSELEKVHQSSLFPSKLLGLNEDAQEIHRDLSAKGYCIPSQVFPGLFPTGSFNAQVLLAHSGYIVLINYGLDEILLRTAGIVVGRSDQTKELRELILHYLYYSDPTATHFPDVRGLFALVATVIYDAAYRFVLAHEYAHIAAGHLDPRRKMFLRTPVGSVEVLKKDWEQEFEADLIAAKVMIEKPDMDLTEVKTTADGILLVFVLDSIITQVRDILSACDYHQQEIQAHPPPNMRAQRLRSYFAHVGEENGWTMEEVYVPMLQKVSNLILDDVAAIKKTAKHINRRKLLNQMFIGRLFARRLPPR